MIPQIPDHTLLRRIGRGSYGEVWLARNVMGAWRAVKLVRRDRFPSARPFEREFEGIRKFEPVSRAHDSQVDILHVGRDEAAGVFYYVMELGDDREHGQDIDPESYSPRTLASDLEKHGRLPAAQTIAVGIALAQALEHLHAHGLIHRDIKPSNIIFVHGRPKLADIGLVAGADEEVSFVGTEGFVPPEGPGTMRADLFSLGKVLYQLHTGLDRSRFPELPAAMLESDDAAMARELNLVILKAAAPEAGRRHSGSRELREELILLQSGHSIRRLRAAERRVILFRWMGVAAGIVAVLSLVAWIAARKSLAIAESARADAERSRNELERNLADARLSQVRAMRESGLAGQRSAALALLSAQAKREPTPELLNEAIAQLARFDFDTTGPASQTATAEIPAQLGVTAGGAWSVRWTAADGVVLRDSAGRELARPDAAFPKFTDKPIAAVHPSRPLIAVIAGDELQGWRLDTWELIVSQKLETPTTAVALHGDLVAAGDVHGGLWLWNYFTRRRHELRAHSEGVDALVFSPNGSLLISHSRNGEMRAWDPLTERLLLTTHGAEPVAFSADGSRLHVRTKDGERDWLVNYSDVLHVFAWPESRGAVDVDFSPDGQLAVGRTDDGFGISDATTGARLTLQPNADLRAAFFVGDGSAIITADASKRSVRAVERPGADWVRMDRRTYRPQRNGEPISAAWIDSTRTLFAWSDSPNHVRFERLTDEKWAGSFTFPATPFSADFSPDGKLGVFGFSKSRALAAWTEGVHNDPAHEFDLEQCTVRFRPDGGAVLLGAPHVYRLYDRQTWRVIGQIPTDSADGEPNPAVWSRDGRLLALVKGGSRIQLLEGANLRPLAELTAPEPARIHSLAFSPDGRRLGVGTVRGRSELWALDRLSSALASSGFSLALPQSEKPAEQPIVLAPKFTPAPRKQVTTATRDAACIADQLDLSPYYNFPLGINWHADREDNILTLPPGLHTLGGTAFDCRGIIELSSYAMYLYEQDAPLEVRGIPINRACDKIHVLCAKCLPGTPKGTTIGYYALNFADGYRWEIPLRVGYEVADWWNLPEEPEASRAVVAWTGENGNTRERNASLRLGKYTIVNPRPGVAVKSFDFTSTLTKAAPFVVAVTVE